MLVLFMVIMSGIFSWGNVLGSPRARPAWIFCQYRIESKGCVCRLGYIIDEDVDMSHLLDG